MAVESGWDKHRRQEGQTQQVNLKDKSKLHSDEISGADTLADWCGPAVSFLGRLL